MEFSQLISAHRLPDNQLRFDQAEMERSILRADERRLRLRAAWQRTRDLGGIVAQYTSWNAILSLGNRHG